MHRDAAASLNANMATWLAAVHEAHANGTAHPEPPVGVSASAAARLRAFVAGVHEEFAAQAPTPAPTHVGRFQILELLGQGRFGVVYRALDPHLNREVALKLPRSPDVDLVRFRHEGQLAAQLLHPGIVQVFEAGEVAGQHYIASELVRGPSLAAWLATRPAVPARVAAALVASLAEAIGVAHDRQIVHRDLKPGNVLLSEPGALATGGSPQPLPDGRGSDGVGCGAGLLPKITDFGLAKCLAADHHLTQPDTVLGTPEYMAPEQAAGTSRDVTAACDLWALGVILYELTTLQLPFPGATTLDTLRQIREADPRPPRQFRRDLPRDVETIALKCLEKDPGRRYASAAALAADLRRFLVGEPIVARPPGPLARARKAVRRHPVVAVTLAALALLVVGMAYHTYRVEREQANTRAALEQARAALYAADLPAAGQAFAAGDVVRLGATLDQHLPTAEAPADRRGFEWYYLNQHRRAPRPGFRAHRLGFSFLQYTADGRSLVTAGDDGNNDGGAFKVWDCATGQLRFTGPIRHWVMPAVARVGPALAHIDAQSRTLVRLIDQTTGRPLHDRPLPHPTPIEHLALSADGRSLVVFGNRVARIWDVANPTTPREFTDLPKSYHKPFLADDAIVYAKRTDPSYHYWHRLADGRLLRVGGLLHGGNDLRLSAQGNFLFGADQLNTGVLWRTANRVPLDWAPPRLRWMAMSDDELLVAGMPPGGDVATVWDVPTRRLRGTYRGMGDRVYAMAISPDRRLLATLAKDGRVSEFDISGQHPPDRLDHGPTLRRPLVWMPDSRSVLAPDAAGNLWVHDTAGTAPRILVPSAHPFADHPVSHVDVSPDGRTLAVVWRWRPETVLVDVATGRRLRTLPGFSADVTRIKLSPDGRRLAAWEETGVHVWDTATGRKLRSVPVEMTGNGSLAFSPDGRYLLTAWERLEVWDLHASPDREVPVCSIKRATGIFGLAIAGDTVYTQERDLKGCCVWSLSADGQLRQTRPPLPVVGSDLQGLSVSRDGSALAVWHLGRTFLYSLPSLDRHVLYGELKAAVIAPDGRSLAVLQPDGALEVWDTRTWRGRRADAAPLGAVRSLAFAPDGRTLLTGSVPIRFGIDYEAAGKPGSLESAPVLPVTAAVRFWDPATGREQPAGLSPLATMAQPSLVAWSPTGLVAAAGEDQGVRVWDRAAGTLVTRRFLSDGAALYFRWHEWWRVVESMTDPFHSAAKKPERPQSLAFSPDGRRLGMAGDRGTVVVWDAIEWRERLRVDAGRDDGERGLAFAPDGRTLAVARGGQVAVWDVETGQEADPVGQLGDAGVYRVAFSPDGTLLATAATDRAVRLWRLRDRTRVQELTTHTDRITALAFAPDGRTLASAGHDHKVRLMNVATGSEVAVLRHNGKVQSLAFAPDGRTLASGDESGEVLMWRAPREGHQFPKIP